MSRNAMVRLCASTFLLIVAWLSSGAFGMSAILIGLALGMREWWPRWGQWLHVVWGTAVFLVLVAVGEGVISSQWILGAVCGLSGGMLLGFTMYWDTAAIPLEGQARPRDRPRAWVPEPDPEPAYTQPREQANTRARPRARGQNQGPRPESTPQPPPRPLTELQRNARILRLTGNVTRSEIKRAYRTLVKQYHPDLWQAAPPEQQRRAEKQTQEINLAYAYFREHYGL